MSWTNVFPVLTEEMVLEFEASSSEDEKKQLNEWFDEKKTINPQKSAKHILSCSLFWKHARSEDSETPQVNRKLLRRMQVPQIGMDAWSHYVAPILDYTGSIREEHSDVAVRVYLAADMEFLVPDLVAVGCEVRLMKHSSIRHNPGAMWRFLAFEDKGVTVTCCDSDRFAMAGLDLQRSTEARKAGLGTWRVPVWGDPNPDGTVPYRPFYGGQFGGNVRMPMRRLMKAFLWQVQRGGISNKCTLSACGSLTIAGSFWPSYGFDEYFLLAAFYPRAARSGILSFVPTDAFSQLLILDIEYATWAHRRSEVVFFGPCACGDTSQDITIIQHRSEESEALTNVDHFEAISTERLTQRHLLPRVAQRMKGPNSGQVWAWFNPCTVKYKGRTLLAYRTECSPRWLWSRVSLAHLSSDCDVVENTNRILRLPTRHGVWGAEDPRFHLYKDRLFLSYNDGSVMGLAELDEQGNVISAQLLKASTTIIDKGRLENQREKNWGFFQSDGGMFISYWVHPHIVYAWDVENSKLETRWQTEWDLPVATGDLHGGSSPVFHDDLFWRVVHSRVPVLHQNGVDRYHLWLMAFDSCPPFRVRWFSKKPLLIGRPDQEPHPEQVKAQVVFCSSLERRADGWFLSFGDNDRRIRSGFIPDCVVGPSLVRIA